MRLIISWALLLGFASQGLALDEAEVRRNAEKAFEELEQESEGGQTRPVESAPKPKPAEPKPKPSPKYPAPKPSTPKAPEPKAPGPKRMPLETSTSEAAPGAIELVSRFRKDATIGALAAARLELPDGAALSIPAGASGESAKASIERLDPSSEGEDPIRIYDVRVSRKLDKPAALTLPVEGGAAAAPQVIHYDEAKGRWERLKAAPVDGGRAVIVELKSSSPVVVSEAGAREQALAAKAGGGVALLVVPYYHQGSSSMWCWSAVLSMLEGFIGRDTKIWTPAAHFKTPLPEALLYPARRMGKYLAQSCPECRSEYKAFYRQGSLNANIKEQLDQGRPVFVDIPAASHAVAAVGYDAASIYLHDPSGGLIANTIGKAPLNNQYIDPKGLKLSSVKLSWSQWDTNMWDAIYNNLTRGATEQLNWSFKPGRVVLPSSWTFVLNAPGAGAPKPLTVQLRPEDDMSNNSLILRHRRPADDSTVRVSWYWDGREKNGFHFKHEGWQDKDPNLCNDDSLGLTRLYVSNVLASDEDAELRLAFDGKEFGSKKIKAEAGRVNIQHEFADKEYAPVLDFRARPVKPGPHELSVELWKDGRRMDRAVLPLLVAPGEVKGVKAVQTASGELVVRWQPLPEESIEGASIVYRVWRTPLANRHFGKLVGESAGGLHRVTIKPEDRAAGHFYSVWAEEKGSGARGLNASYHKAEKESAGADEWRLIETGYEVWDGKSLELGSRVFKPGREARTPSGLTKWKIGPDGFELETSSPPARMKSKWDKMPEKLSAKPLKWSVESSVDGENSLQTGLSPVGPICEWSIAMTNEETRVKKLSFGLQSCDGAPPSPTHRLDLKGEAGGKPVSGRMDLKLAVRPIASTKNAGKNDLKLFLELNFGNLAKAVWAFEKAETK